ncbi:MAG: LysM peptidoglycan-binding domain-containing protein [Nitrospira sp.]
MKKQWWSAPIGIILLGLSACSSLEPIFMEPEVSDLQLTVDSLKASWQDAQRTVVELRAEVDARRQEFSEAQIIRAQLEGSIREAERRLAEARHVIDLQREELAHSRSERHQVRRTSAGLQNQLKQLQKQVSKIGTSVKGHMSPAAMPSSGDEPLEFTAVKFQQDALPTALGMGTRAIPELATPALNASSVDDIPVVSPVSPVAPRGHVLIKSGDTLWSLARRYHTSVDRLMGYNALLSDRIQIGQILWLDEPFADEPARERM